MFDNLKKHIESTSIEGLFVNKSTGEWVGGASKGYEYLTRAEILALEGAAEAESPKPEGEEKSTGKKKR